MSKLDTVSNFDRQLIGARRLPNIITASGDDAARRFLEYFAVTIRNSNTRAAYMRAVARFTDWLDTINVKRLQEIQPMHVAAYVEAMSRSHAAPTAKQHLAAIRALGDWLVTGQILSINPATSVKGPAHSQLKGRTPHLTAEEMRQLLDSIPTQTITGIRDKALISVMAYSFARVGAAVAMDVTDLYTRGRTLWLRLAEKGGKQHEMPCHHELAACLDAYLDAAGLRDQSSGPLFRSATRARIPELTNNRLRRENAWAMVKRRALAAGLDPSLCNHSFRATGITNFLENGGAIEQARAMAAHSSIRTTQLYDRRSDEVTVDEINRIRYR